MKKILLLFILCSVSAYSQVELNRSIIKEVFNKSIIDDEYRTSNFYTKDDNFMYDIEIPIQAPYDGWQKYRNVLEERCKADIYKAVDNYFSMEILLNMQNDCQYKNIFFNYSYITPDLRAIKLPYFINIKELIAIKQNLNKKDVYAIIN